MSYLPEGAKALRVGDRHIEREACPVEFLAPFPAPEQARSFPHPDCPVCDGSGEVLCVYEANKDGKLTFTTTLDIRDGFSPIVL